MLLFVAFCCIAQKDVWGRADGKHEHLRGAGEIHRNRSEEFLSDDSIYNPFPSQSLPLDFVYSMCACV